MEWAYGCSVAGKCGMLAAAPKTWADAPEKTWAGASEPRRTTRDDELDDEWINQGAGGYRGVVWVYACGALGVVFDASAWRQRFFRGHDDEIVSLATHASGRWAATGQRSGRAPCACVWEIATGKEVARLRHEPGERAVVAIAFGPGLGDPNVPGGGAARIATIAADSKHTVRVWDWGGGHPGRPKPAVLTRAVGFSGTPPQVFGATWAPDADRFATFGVKHVKLWTPAAESESSFVSSGSRPQGADAAAAAAAARRRAEAARNAAMARGANAAAVEYAGRVCVYGTAARVCAREFGVDQLNHLKTCSSSTTPYSRGGSVSTATSSDALCGAFVPGCRGRRLVTGHADGKLYVWFDRTCERVVDAHGDFPVRAMTVQMTMRERAANAMAHASLDANDVDGGYDGDNPGLGGRLPGLGVEIITGAHGGLVRRWDVVEDWAIVRAETLGNEAAIPREAPRGFRAVWRIIRGYGFDSSVRRSSVGIASRARGGRRGRRDRRRHLRR